MKELRTTLNAGFYLEIIKFCNLNVLVPFITNNIHEKITRF